MGGLFSECISLVFFPDISIWNVSNIINITGMFYKCSKELIPNISKLEFNKQINLKSIFQEVNALNN